MSRAFVINGDEWGYCIKMSRKCSGADSQGECMRSECTETEESEKPRRSLDDIRREKIEAALKAQLEAERTAALEKAAQEKAKKSRKK